MKSGSCNFLTHIFHILFLLCFVTPTIAQDDDYFEPKLRFGGSLGLAIGSGYTDVTIAPGAMYDINRYFGIGAGLQGTYVKQRNYFTSFLYGGSVIGVFNPIEEIQLSAEVEQLRVNLEGEDDLGKYERNFWNTALFAGVGYRAQNVTIGVRYNLLFNKRDLVYSDALMPFIRVYF